MHLNVPHSTYVTVHVLGKDSAPRSFPAAEAHGPLVQLRSGTAQPWPREQGLHEGTANTRTAGAQLSYLVI